MRKATCEIFPEGGIIRMKNKRISFKIESIFDGIKHSEGKVMIKFQMADTEPDVPACSHKCIKGKVRETFIQMSNGAMDTLVLAYTKHKNLLAQEYRRRYHEMKSDTEFQNWKIAVDDDEKEESELYQEYLKEKKQNENKV